MYPPFWVIQFATVSCVWWRTNAYLQVSVKDYLDYNLSPCHNKAVTSSDEITAGWPWYKVLWLMLFPENALNWFSNFTSVIKYFHSLTNESENGFKHQFSSQFSLTFILALSSLEGWLIMNPRTGTESLSGPLCFGVENSCPSRCI